MTIAGLILAGGRSRRMGREKAFLPIGTTSMLQRMHDRFSGQVGPLAINANGDISRFGSLGLPVVSDDRPDTGPLGGILAGMRWAETLSPAPAFLATVPIDTPFLPLDLVRRLDDARGGIPIITIAASGERDHPVVALWPVSLADRLSEWRFTARSQGVRGFLATCGFTVVTYRLPEHGPDPFFNVNTEENLAEAEGWLATTPRL